MSIDLIRPRNSGRKVVIANEVKQSRRLPRLRLATTLRVGLPRTLRVLAMTGRIG